jgi:hypothetical protein
MHTSNEYIEEALTAVLRARSEVEARQARLYFVEAQMLGVIFELSSDRG